MIVMAQFNVIQLKVVDRADLFSRTTERNRGECIGHTIGLFMCGKQMIRIDVYTAPHPDEFFCPQSTEMRNHMQQQSISSDIERNAQDQIGRP